MSRVAEPYLHTQETPMQPEVGTQAQFKKRKAPKTYRYDSSLHPALSWDDGASRTIGEWLLGLILEAHFDTGGTGIGAKPMQRDATAFRLVGAQQRVSSLGYFAARDTIVGFTP